MSPEQRIDDRKLRSTVGSDDFILTKIAVLKQVAHAQGLPGSALHVALVYVEHCNRKAGLTFPSQETIARILHLDTRTVRRCTDALKRLGVLIPAGRRAGTRVKQYELRPDPSYKQNLWPREAPAEPSSNAAYSGENRTKESGSASSPYRTQVSGSPISQPDNSGHLDRTPSVPETGQESPKEPSEKPFDEPVPTTARDSLLGPSNEKALKEEQENLELAAQILDVELTPKREARWRKDLAWYAAQNIDFCEHVVPAMNDAVRRAAENGTPLSVTTLRYFVIPATQMRDCFRLAVLAGNQTLQPTVPPLNQAAEDRDTVETAFSFMQYESTPDRLKSFIASLCNLRNQGFDFMDDIWPKIDRCLALGIVPKDVRSFSWFVEKAPGRIARAQRAREARRLSALVGRGGRKSKRITLQTGG